ncbi:MAG: CHAT domain-containing protein [Muribaculaceae bacterium]|nr:CHAT domain-containing protein [Muribaculaceae bacterium]
MKIIEDSQGSVKKKFLFSRLFAELYYFFALHLYALFTILGCAISIAILLFFAELIFPEAVHIFNYSMTDKVFTELVNDHKYHAAIAFMDTKKDLIGKSKDPYKFRQELADCYVHTGDYPKALEQYRLVREWFDQMIVKETPKDWTPAQIKQFKEFINICLLREEYNIYLKMGDIANVTKYYGMMKTLHETTDWDNLGNFLGEEGMEKLNDVLKGHRFEDGFKFELIQGKYLTNPDAAITEMEDYAITVANSKDFNQRYKLKLFNELIRMLIEQDLRITARHYLEIALQIADSLEYNPIIYDRLGDLSEYCYQLNDVDDGRRLLKKYLYHIDDTYDKNDIEYAVAHAMEFKYLEADGDWNALTDKVIDASAALRERIVTNFTGMTSAQREYFIEQFKPLFSYTNRLMESHPSDALAIACFENNMFLKGLLLRSETSVTNAIAAMGDKELTSKYNRFVEASQELISRQYVSGPGNYYAKKILGSEIATLESEIANASRDFRRGNETASLSVPKLRKSLGSDGIAMQIVEGDKTVYALLMDKSGKVAYQPIATKDRLTQLTGTHGSIYVDADAVGELFDSIIPLITGKELYLTTCGVFNQIAFSSLPVDKDGHIISDLTKLHIVGSPTDIPAIKAAEAINLTAQRSMLWGGIDYGSTDSTPPAEISDTRGIMRGDRLGTLRYSLSEVNEISRILRRGGGNATVVSGSAATEKSFTSRNHKRDYILHVSTHGFFHDSGSFTNPMRNSGLLFANSQKYWANDSLVVSSINDDDGILRADEIARLDLGGCRLVVLSACQTGLGEYNSEGVYGLQRAFKLAGAQSILMSLWSVDDRATAELMTEFYHGLIAGKDPDRALVGAQRAMRTKGYSPDKWAAFILLN